jgi:hypothetical protein
MVWLNTAQGQDFIRGQSKDIVIDTHGESASMVSLQEQMSTLSKQIARLEDRLAEVCGDVAELESVLAPFLARYQKEVLRYHQELVRVQREIADMRIVLGDRATAGPGLAESPLNRFANEDYVPVQEQYERVWKGKRPPKPTDPRNLPPASPALKEAYRQVVAKIHPALAKTTSEQKRNKELMEKANQAYVRRDEVTLRATAQALSRQSNLPAIVDEKVVKELRDRAYMLEQLIFKLEGESFELQHGAVAKIRAFAEQAEAQGRDFLLELKAELQATLKEAQRERVRLKSLL